MNIVKAHSDKVQSLVEFALEEIDKLITERERDRLVGYTMIIKATTRFAPSGLHKSRPRSEIIIRANETHHIEDIRYVTAHEIGHAINGRSETDAANFAVVRCGFIPVNKYRHNHNHRMEGSDK